METVTPPHKVLEASEVELHLLPQRYLEADWRLWRVAAAGSVAFHIITVLLMLTVKVGPPAPSREERPYRRVTPLYIPRDLTQKAPNTEPVRKELTIASIAPHPMVKSPAAAPAPRPGQKAKALPMPPPQVTPVRPKEVVIEPPRMEAAAQNPPATQIPKPAALPPPTVNGPPKIAFEDIMRGQKSPGAARPTGAITMPDTSIAGTVRSLSRGGAQGLSVNDADLGGLGAGLNLPASAGRPQSSLQLASDPMGVDFRAYIIQVLAAVRRNWFAVYPEAARLGMRGQVVLKFGINKRGLVTTVNFSSQSGAQALDQSAVASISASNPLPPLPLEFKGDHIVLQMTFSYNLPRQ
ncbi:MAG: TonB family protein [Terriglobia bacterium]